MKNWKFVAFLAALTISTLSAFGAERIEGAFGKKLGDVFDPETAIGKTSLEDGTPMYEVSTTNGFRAFKRYYVIITPVTRKIYSIWAIGNAENAEIAKKEQALILEILKEKYGSEEKAGFMDQLSDVKRINQGGRYILSKVSGFSSVTHDLRYYDRELEQLAEKERITEEAKKVNKGGL